MILKKNKREIVIFRGLTIEKIEDMNYEQFLDNIEEFTKADFKELSKIFFKFIKGLLARKYHNMPWQDVEEEYFKDKDILRRYILVKSFIFQNYLAEDPEKLIERELKRIADRVDSLPEGVTSPEAGKKHYGINSADYEAFIDLIDDYCRSLTNLFQRVSLIYAKDNRQQYLEERADKRLSHKIEKIGEAGGLVSYQAQMGKDIDDQIRRDERVLTKEEIAMDKDKTNNIFEKNVINKQKN